jgi:acyl-coenzyme A synthetase/AMP-(fatty) acid ligase
MPFDGPSLARPFALADLLANGLARQPDEPALITNGGHWTWRELEAASSRLARHYLALGLRPGDRVASLMPNCGELVIHYLACFKAGLAATPLNYRYQAPEIDHALEVSGAAILLAHAEREADLARSKLASVLPLGQIVFAAAPPLPAGGPSRRLEQLLETAAPEISLAQPASTATALIFFTSGSTGKPKGVTHSHETFGWIAASFAAGAELTTASIFLPGTSASHVAAVSMTIGTLGAGARVALAHTTDPDEMLTLLRKSQATGLCMLPAALFGVVRDHAATREDFRSLRLCISGGDKVSTELEREFTSLAGFVIDECYGMTETGTITLNPITTTARLGSIGTLCPGYQASIRDDTGREVPTGETGRLWVRSPMNMLGYWNHPEATAETIVDTWLDTGDLVSVDADGYLWFRGRKKQIIIHDGSNICPQEVEYSLLEHPAVAAAGVIGIHDLVHGENVRAYVVLKAEVARPTAAELMQFSRARVGYKAPSEIVVIEEMPLNATGKVDRVVLKELAANGSGLSARTCSSVK